MNLFVKLLLFFLISLSFQCKEKYKDNNFVFTKPGIFVGNEGNFTFSNSSLSYINLENDSIMNNVFIKKNNFPLGDIAQYMCQINGKLYVVVNNSGKIVVLNSKNGKYIATIGNLSSPRFILCIDSTKAYVGDLYGTTIAIINPSTYSISGYIQAGFNTGKMLKFDNYVFVANWNKGNQIIKINAETDQVIDSLRVTNQPNSLQIDKYGRLWVLSDGGMNPDSTLNMLPALSCINPVNLKIIKTFYFESKASSPTNLCINSSLDTVFFLNSSWNGTVANGGVFEFCVDDTNLPSKPLIAENERQFYSMAVKDSYIIVSDAKDFVQEGDVLIFNKKGELLKKFQAGINPSYFLFNE